jgi:hypothetical protein
MVWRAHKFNLNHDDQSMSIFSFSSDLLHVAILLSLSALMPLQILDLARLQDPVSAGRQQRPRPLVSSRVWRKLVS